MLLSDDISGDLVKLISGGKINNDTLYELLYQPSKTPTIENITKYIRQKIAQSKKFKYNFKINEQQLEIAISFCYKVLNEHFDDFGNRFPCYVDKEKFYNRKIYRMVMNIQDNIISSDEPNVSFLFEIFAPEPQSNWSHSDHVNNINHQEELNIIFTKEEIFGKDKNL